MPTAEQAREQWCPMVRIARRETLEPNDRMMDAVVVGGCNSDALGKNRVPASCRCIADACAMWRWAGGRKENDGWTASSGVAPPPLVKTTQGYCGLAGRPEVFE